MASKNGRDNQLSLVRILRRHPTYWIHNDIGMMFLSRNVIISMVGVGDVVLNDVENNNGVVGGSMAMEPRVISKSAVDADEVGSSDDEDQG